MALLACRDRSLVNVIGENRLTYRRQRLYDYSFLLSIVHLSLRVTSCCVHRNTFIKTLLSYRLHPDTAMLRIILRHLMRFQKILCRLHAVMWCLGAVPRLEAASRQISTALALVLVLNVDVLALFQTWGLVSWSWFCHKTETKTLCSKARRNTERSRQIIVILTQNQKFTWSLLHTFMQIFYLLTFLP